MAAELGLLSLTQLQKLAQPRLPNSFSSMWNPKQVAQDEEDSWEIRAFEQDTGNINGTTWPPRSYTCTFCRREFRSAQALGGHMNVHRRDRARLHHGHPDMSHPTSPSAGSSAVLIPTQDFVRNGGLCLVYSLANPNGTVLTPKLANSYMDSPSALLSVSGFPTTNLGSNCPRRYNYPATPHNIHLSNCHSSNTEPSASNGNENHNSLDHDTDENKKDSEIEELDLELRLGRQ